MPPRKKGVPSRSSPRLLAKAGTKAGDSNKAGDSSKGEITNDVDARAGDSSKSKSVDTRVGDSSEDDQEDVALEDNRKSSREKRKSLATESNSSSSKRSRIGAAGLDIFKNKSTFKFPSLKETIVQGNQFDELGESSGGGVESNNADDQFNELGKSSEGIESYNAMTSIDHMEVSKPSGPEKASSTKVLVIPDDLRMPSIDWTADDVTSFLTANSENFYITKMNIQNLARNSINGKSLDMLTVEDFEKMNVTIGDRHSFCFLFDCLREYEGYKARQVLSSSHPSIGLSTSNISNPLESAIQKAGLMNEATKNGRTLISLLNQKERVKVLQYLGQKPDESDLYYTLFRTACNLQKSRDSSIGDVIGTILSTSNSDEWLPIVGVQHLFVRASYLKLYDKLSRNLTKKPNHLVQNRCVITGTSGIGKSVFLVYFVIRCLVECNNDNLPIIVFHVQDSSPKCYVFGGTFTCRTGSIDDFAEILHCHETWYLADSVPNPVSRKAKTVLAASPELLHSDNRAYQEFIKTSPTMDFMAPWSWKELNDCRRLIFPNMSIELTIRLYTKVGGIPRYVLMNPSTELTKGVTTATAEKLALTRLNEALNKVVDAAELIECVARAKEYLRISSRLLHRWPYPDDSTNYYVKWASQYVLDKLNDRLTEKCWSDILKKIKSRHHEGSDRGLEFELYVHHLFRKGGFTFYMKRLNGVDEVNEPYAIDIPLNPTVKYIRHYKELSGSLSDKELVNLISQDEEEITDEMVAEYQDDYLPDEELANLTSQDEEEITDEMVAEYQDDHLPDEELANLISQDEEITDERAVEYQENDDNILIIPNIPNFAAADFFFLPSFIFQATVSRNHPIKQARLCEIIKQMPIYKQSPDEKIKFVFVVPDDIYDNFKTQNYMTSGPNSHKVKQKSKIIKSRVEQWALKIDLGRGQM